MMIGFVGGGTIAFAMASALIARGVTKPSNVYASGPNIKNSERWRKLGAHITEKNGLVVTKCDTIFICVRPHLIFKCAQEIEGNIEPSVCDTDKLFISVVAGINVDTLKLAFSFMKAPKIIRAIANIPVLVSEGIVVYTSSRYVTADDLEKVKLVFNALGIIHEVPENMMDALTSLNACGTAYVFTVIEAMADGMNARNIPYSIGVKIAAQTAAGAARMALESSKHPGILRDEFCSPGGSTIYGIHELEKFKIRNGFINAIEISTKLNQKLDEFCR